MAKTSVMFFEVDNSTIQPNGTNAPSCRLLVGFDAELGSFDSRVYAQDRLLCSANKTHYDNVTNVTYVDVVAVPPPKYMP